MATRLAPVDRAYYDAAKPFIRVVPKPVTIPTTDRHEPTDDGLNASRGILVGLLLCVPFWVGMFKILF